MIRARRRDRWQSRCLLDQLVGDHLEGLDDLLGTRENDGALGACDEEGHEALRGGTENTDLLVEVDEVPLRGSEDLSGTLQERTGGCGNGDGEEDAVPRPSAVRQMGGSASTVEGGTESVGVSLDGRVHQIEAASADVIVALAAQAQKDNEVG